MPLLCTMIISGVSADGDGVRTIRAKLLGQNLHTVADVDMKTGHTGILSESGTIVKRSGGFLEFRYKDETRNYDVQENF